MSVQLNREQLAHVYQPRGAKNIRSGDPITFSATGYVGAPYKIPSSEVDLSFPLFGMKFVFKGRLTVGTAAFSSVNPEGLLNLINNIDIFGDRVGMANTHLFSMDGPFWAAISAMHRRRGAKVYISKAGGPLTLDPPPGTPYGASGFDGSVNTFDFIISIRALFYPLSIGKGLRAGFLVRNEEWADSMQISIQPGGQAAAGAGALGTQAATGTIAFSAFGSASGTPTVDVYLLPASLGNIAHTLSPGLVLRARQPQTSPLQSVANNVKLLTLQKQDTGRIYVKAGISTVDPVYTQLADDLITAIGIKIGTNKDVKPINDWYHVKEEASEEYDIDPITGYAMLDFMQSESSFAAYPGSAAKEGTTFEVRANVNGVANGAAEFVQEQITVQPGGALYTG